MKVRSLCPWFCAMLLLAASAIPVRAQSDATDAERQFLWQEANAAAARANTPEDYLRVAAKYQQLGDMGARNGTLFYNMGTVLLGAGQYEQAWQALLRAERYLGNTGDLQQNLALEFSHDFGCSPSSLFGQIFVVHPLLMPLAESGARLRAAQRTGHSHAPVVSRPALLALRPRGAGARRRGLRGFRYRLPAPRLAHGAAKPCARTAPRCGGDRLHPVRIELRDHARARSPRAPPGPDAETLTIPLLSRPARQFLVVTPCGLDHHSRQEHRSISSGCCRETSAREEARQLGLRGFVRNEMNGTVYAEVEGEEAQVNSFVMWCHHGPPSAHVDRVTVTEGPMQNWTSFGVRYS